MTLHRKRRFLAPALLALVGCGQSGPTTHAVAGRVEYAGGDVAQLAGHTVEVAHTANPNVRAFGTIEPDGRFKLETYENGQFQHGAKEGTYSARIVIADEGDGRSKKPKIAPRFLKFEKSGLTVTVPPPGDVQLTVGAK